MAATRKDAPKAALERISIENPIFRTYAYLNAGFLDKKPSISVFFTHLCNVDPAGSMLSPAILYSIPISA